jgi:hypothetical protein
VHHQVHLLVVALDSRTKSQRIDSGVHLAILPSLDQISNSHLTLETTGQRLLWSSQIPFEYLTGIMTLFQMKSNLFHALNSNYHLLYPRRNAARPLGFNHAHTLLIKACLYLFAHEP